MPVNKETLKSILNELLERCLDIKAALIATSDGMLVTNVNLSGRSNQLAAMAAATIGLGKQIIANVSNSQMNEITVTGTNGQVFIYSISPKSVLIIVTKEQPNSALINWESRKTIAQLLSA